MQAVDFNAIFVGIKAVRAWSSFRTLQQDLEITDNVLGFELRKLYDILAFYGPIQCNRTVFFFKFCSQRFAGLYINTVCLSPQLG